MAARKIGLVHPPLDSFPSGGNVYNTRLLQCACPKGAQLASLAVREEALPAGAWDLLTWDSLLLDRVARVGGERVGLLLHYLPSLEPDLDPRKKETLATLETRAMAQADFAIATGRPVAEALATRWPEKPVFTCEPGVGTVFLSRNGTRRARAPVKLLTVAHLRPGKGHRHLLEILRRLEDLSWHWEVVGDCRVSPETARELRERAAEAGLTDRMTLRGLLGQEEIASLMAESDLLVSPSTFEAYGMTVAESAAAGLPVLTNRVGAAAQLIEHGVTGFLAAPGDWEGFGRYLRALLEDPELRAALRMNLGGSPVRSWDRTVADFNAACETMLA